MIKLLYITNQVCGAAGLERVLSIKTHHLIDTYNYEIHIITLNQGEKPLFYNFNESIHYHDIHTGNNPLTFIKRYIYGIKRVVKAIKPNIISVCDDGLKGFFLPLILSKPCPVIYERHVSKHVEHTQDALTTTQKVITSIKYKLMHLLARTFDKFVVLTNDNIKEWQLNNIHVISNPLSFYPEDKAPLENKVVLAVGRQSFQKGYDRLIQSWQLVSKKHPDWQLKIFGKIDSALKLDALARQLKIQEKISFHKPVKNIENIYKSASVYVMSSRFEGFGMVLIEAMSCGLPVISYNCPCGPSDIITHEQDGFLVENNDIEAFADSICFLIENKHKRLDMGERARINSKRYLPAEIIPQWHELFNELVKK